MKTYFQKQNIKFLSTLFFLCLLTNISKANNLIQFQNGTYYYEYTQGNNSWGSPDADCEWVKIVINGDVLYHKEICFENRGWNNAINTKDIEIEIPQALSGKRAEVEVIKSSDKEGTVVYDREKMEQVLPFRHEVDGMVLSSTDFENLACDGKAQLYDPEELTPEKVLEIHQNVENSFVKPRGYVVTYLNETEFRINFTNTAYDAVKFYQGSYKEPEDGKIHNLYRGNYRDHLFRLKGQMVYHNKERSFNRLIVLEFYQQKTLKKVMIMPIITLGPTFTYDKDKNDKPIEITSAPILETVLHNPPGDGSFVYLETSTENCTEMSFESETEDRFSQEIGLSMEGGVNLGPINVGAKAGVTGSYGQTNTTNTENTSQTCRTVSRRISYKGEKLGVKGDLFIGSATTYKVTLATFLDYRDCGLKVDQTYKFKRLRSENFLYTVDELENKVLPDLRSEKSKINQNSEAWRTLDRDIKTWEKYLRLNRTGNYYSAEIDQERILGGANNIVDSEIEAVASSSYTVADAIRIDQDLLLSLEVTAGGATVTSETGIGFSTTVRTSKSNTNTNTKAIGYSLMDNQVEDDINVIVKEDKVFGSHIFQIKENSKSSCPYEGRGIALNQPQIRVLDNGREKAFINVSGPRNSSLNVPLRLKNLSDIERTYRLRLADGANARVELGVNTMGLDGFTKEYKMAAGQEITLGQAGYGDLLYVKQNHNSKQSEYIGITLVLEPVCGEDADLAEEIIINAYFTHEFEISTVEQTVDIEEGKFTVDVTSSNDWTVFADQDWVYLSENAGSKNGTIEIEYEANNIRESRTAQITFESEYGIKKVLTLNQEANLNIPVYGTGLFGTYYDEVNFKNRSFTRTDATIDFKWENGAPNSEMGNDTYSVVWEGEVRADYNEVYTFITRSDDGVRLWVDGELIIDKWIVRWPTTYRGEIRLEAGKRVPIRLEYFEQGGGAEVQLKWESNSQAEEVIPKENLYPTHTSNFSEDFDSYESGYQNFTTNAMHWHTKGDNTPDPGIQLMENNLNNVLYIPRTTNSRETGSFNATFNLGKQEKGAYQLSMGLGIFKNSTATLVLTSDRSLPLNNAAVVIQFEESGEAWMEIDGTRNYFTYPAGNWFHFYVYFDLEREIIYCKVNQNQWIGLNVAASSLELIDLEGITFFNYNNTEYYLAYINRYSYDQTTASSTKALDSGMDIILEKVPTVATSFPKNQLVEPETIQLKTLSNTLGQNYPNPVRSNTIIPVALAEEVQKAWIDIISKDGRAITRIPVDQRGKIAVQFSPDNLSTGIYFYTLTVDGELIETKRMSIINN